ncbi:MULTISPECIES: hypothetical protein [unclassified Aureispira]|uniref:hypothetical protein n=1 Tax=unclassified Aureispira TaxID=2649989 RepID=UPI0006963B39|nr:MULTISPECIES: hypothetical protein [unclassified Aureispira]WMX12755.1 hypothetical protein QP953_18130 [Aureispira sp. CCB-E]
MKKEIRIDLSVSQHPNRNNPVQVNSWVNKALDARNNINTPKEHSSGRKLQLNMTFCKSILNRR